jgi:protoheme IX farnesyltransferase
VYTPLKTLTAWNTLVGAVPGALPPLIGAAAAAGTLRLSDWSLATLLFLWQFPHFWSIAWIYRDDYARGGLVMLPHVDSGQGGLTGRLMFKTSVWLVLISLLPTFLGEAGLIYFWTALVIGLGFASANLAFWLRPSVANARLVLRSSLMYLPAVLLLWMLDGPLRWRL